MKKLNYLVFFSSILLTVVNGNYLFFAKCFLTLNAGVAYPTSYEYTYEISPRYSVSWTIDTYMSVKVVSKVNSWAGLCFNPSKIILMFSVLMYFFQTEME